MYYIGFSDLLQLVDKFFWIGGIPPVLSCLYVKTITIAEITAVRISDTGIERVKHAVKTEKTGQQKCKAYAEHYFTNH